MAIPPVNKVKTVVEDVAKRCVCGALIKVDKPTCEQCGKSVK